jgi:hypothetical protein
MESSSSKGKRLLDLRFSLNLSPYTAETFLIRFPCLGSIRPKRRSDQAIMNASAHSRQLALITAPLFDRVLFTSLFIPPTPVVEPAITTIAYTSKRSRHLRDCAAVRRQLGMTRRC